MGSGRGPRTAITADDLLSQKQKMESTSGSGSPSSGSCRDEAEGRIKSLTCQLPTIAMEGYMMKKKGAGGSTRSLLRSSIGARWVTRYFGEFFRQSPTTNHPIDILLFAPCIRI